MAGIDAFSFDDLNTTQILQRFTQTAGFATAAVPFISADAGVRGGYGLAFQNANESVGSLQLQVVYSTITSTTAIVGIRFRATSLAALGGNLAGGQYAHMMLTLMKGSQIQIQVQPNTDGTLSVYRGGDHQLGESTLLGTTVNALTDDTFQYLWIKVVFHATTGSITIKVDNESWMALTLQNTIAGGSTPYWDTVGLGPIHISNGHGGVQWLYYDDVIIMDGAGSRANNIPTAADGLVDCLWGFVAGSSANFTPLANANFQEAQDGIGLTGEGNDADLSTNESAVFGDTDLFGFENLPTPSDANNLFMKRNVVARAPAGAGHIVNAVYSSSGSDYVGTGSTALTKSYADKSDIVELCPRTNLPWKNTDVALPNQHGYRKTA